MKVIVYFNSMSPAGGIERVISKHIEFLSSTYEITLITKDGANSFYSLPKNVFFENLSINFSMNMYSRIFRLFKILSLMFLTIIRLKAKISKINPKFVYVATPLNLMECWLSGVPLKKILVTEHSSYDSYNRIYKFIIKSLYPKVGILAVPTTSDSATYWGMNIPNSYLPNPLPFFPESLSTLTFKNALCIGRLTDDKRHNLLIDIWNNAEIYKIGWKLQIVGKGENFNMLQNKIKNLGLESSISIQNPIKNIQEFYTKSSIFLLTSRSEGFGLVLAEAMSFGVPCISFNCPSGPRDIIQDGVSGILLNEGDISGYVNSLRKMATEIEYRKSLGMKARNNVSKFHSDKISEIFLMLTAKL